MMCGTIPSSHWLREQRFNLGPGARSRRNGQIPGRKGAVPVPLKRIEPVRWHRVVAAVVAAQYGDLACSILRSWRLMTGSSVRRPAWIGDRTSARGRAAGRASGCRPGLTAHVAVEHRAEQLAVHFAGDKQMRAQRFHHLGLGGQGPFRQAAGLRGGRRICRALAVGSGARPWSARPHAICRRPAAVAGRKFIGGLPMKPATNSAAGLR